MSSSQPWMKARLSTGAIFERTTGRRASMHVNSDTWWRLRVLKDTQTHRGGGTAIRVACAYRDGAVTGLCTFRHRGGFADDSPGSISVSGLYSDDDRAYETLWRFLTSIDLFRKVNRHLTPVDDPLPSLVTNPRAIVRTVEDALWVRILNVENALTARTYQHDIDVVLEVKDSFRPELGGRFRLPVVDGRAACARTGNSPDVKLGIEHLSSLYLGGGSALQLAAAGHIAGDGVTIRRLENAFHTVTAPFCQAVF